MKTRLYSLSTFPIASHCARFPRNSIRTLGTQPSNPQRHGSSRKNEQPPQRPSIPQHADSKPPPPSVSDTLAATSPEDNGLLAPVHISEDPNAVLRSQHPSTSILAQSGLVIQRQIEMMNLFIGFEQANRYVIMDPRGNHVGYMAEHDGGIGKAMTRQWFRTHRAFTTNVFDRSGKEVLRFHRPFSWINTRIRIYDPLDYSQIPPSSSTNLATADPEIERRISSIPIDAMRIIGEAHSEWAPLRRKYNLFLTHDPSATLSDSSPARTSSFFQFAYINEPFLSWDFSLLGADQRLVGSVNRNFAGFGREIFTDTGVYALRMDSAGLEEEAQKSHIISKTGQSAYAETVGGAGMTLDQRAVMLATAVTVDYDYFSRHSHGGGGMMLPFMWGGGGEAAGGAAAGGAAEGAVVGTAGRAVGGAAAGEGAIAGAGTMAGYEAMQRGIGHEPIQDQPNEGFGDPQPPQPADGGDVWGGGENDPWTGSGGGGGESEGGGGFFSWLWNLLFGD